MWCFISRCSGLADSILFTNRYLVFTQRPLCSVTQAHMVSEFDPIACGRIIESPCELSRSIFSWFWLCSGCVLTAYRPRTSYVLTCTCCVLALYWLSAGGVQAGISCIMVVQAALYLLCISCVYTVQTAYSLRTVCSLVLGITNCYHWLLQGLAWGLWYYMWAARLYVSVPGYTG